MRDLMHWFLSLFSPLLPFFKLFSHIPYKKENRVTNREHLDVDTLEKTSPNVITTFLTLTFIPLWLFLGIFTSLKVYST